MARIRTSATPPTLVALPANPHPIVATWIERSRAAAPATFDSPETAIRRRIWRVHDTILKEAEMRGHTIEHPKNSFHDVWLVIDGERVDWFFHERDYLRKVPLTKAELKHWLNAERTWRQVKVPSGFLVLTVRAEYNSDQRIDERPGHLLEKRAANILNKFESVATRTVEGRRWQAEFYMRQKRRARREKIRRIEEERWMRLRDMASEWSEAERLRKFVEAVARRMDELKPRPPRVDAWLDWARWRVDDFDPLAEDTEAVFAKTIQRPRRISEYEREFGEEEDEDA